METPVGKIPMDWKASRLVDVADYLNGYAFGPDDWKAKGLPIIRIQNLNNVDAEFNYFDGEIDERYIIRKGDLLFSWSASIGVYLWNRQKAVLNQHIFKVTPRDKVDKTYLYYALFLAIEQLKKRVHGSTMKHFKRGELKRTFIALPPFKEQQEIARVLACVDDAIRQVELAIAKTERLKKGLMQKLLTEGIGHEEFKETRIGRLAKIWKVVRLGDVANKVGSGLTPRGGSSTYLDSGIPFIRSQNVQMNRLGTSDIAFISRETHEDMERSKVLPGDVLLNITGASIGRVATVPEYVREANVNQHVCRIRLSEEFVPKFVSYYLSSLSGQHQIMSFQAGATRQGLNYKQVRSILLPFPPHLEQREIVKILASTDHKFQLENKRKEKFERVKRGLMNDLLTGRRRVKVAT